jgi:hypothetical protein
MDRDRDLFGQPLRGLGCEAGRPAHVATAENRAKVDVLRSNGWSKTQIARLLGLSRPTFRKHYCSSAEAKQSR